MKKILIVLAALTLPASARIGENPEQLATRYGKAELHNGSSELRFQKNGIYVSAILWNGVCHSIEFCTNPPTWMDESALPAKAALLTETQIQQLLAANGGASKWKEVTENVWITDDKKLNAFFSDGMLTISTVKYHGYMKAQDQKTDSKRVEGF